MTYGLTLRYKKAWRAREHALEVVTDGLDEAYAKLPMQLIGLERNNTGSKANMEVDRRTF